MSKQRVALYLRVSTDEQSVENQRRELTEWAARSGLEVTAEYADEGISGSKGRDKRPGLDALLKDAARRRFDVVAVWAVDRLGRSTLDLLTTLKHFHESGVDLFIHRQALDTRTHAGKMMFGMLGLFAEFERDVNSERTKAGLAKARAQGRVGGRRKVPQEPANRYCWLRDWGVGINKAAKVAGIGNNAGQRLERERRNADDYEPRAIPAGVDAAAISKLSEDELWTLVTQGVKREDWHAKRSKEGKAEVGAEVLARHREHMLLPMDEQRARKAAATRRVQARKRRARKAK